MARILRKHISSPMEMALPGDICSSWTLHKRYVVNYRLPGEHTRTLNEEVRAINPSYVSFETITIPRDNIVGISDLLTLPPETVRLIVSFLDPVTQRTIVPIHSILRVAVNEQYGIDLIPHAPNIRREEVNRFVDNLSNEIISKLSPDTHSPPYIHPFEIILSLIYKMELPTRPYIFNRLLRSNNPTVSHLNTTVSQLTEFLLDFLHKNQEKVQRHELAIVRESIRLESPAVDVMESILASMNPASGGYLFTREAFARSSNPIIRETFSKIEQERNEA